MIEAKINYHFCEIDLPLLKAAAELHLRDISPTHRLEILARGCGFNSMAAFRAVLVNSGRAEVELDLSPSVAIAFATDRGHDFSEQKLHEILVSAARPKVARENPLLHNWGYGLGCLEPRRDERQRIISGLAFKEQRRAVRKAIAKDLKERREKLLRVEPQREFLHALAFASCIKPLKHPNLRRNSYGLKHIAENLTFCLDGQVRLPREYVSNTDLIAAALYAGFNVHSPEFVDGDTNRSPNPEFNMSERSIASLIKEREQQQLIA